MVIFVSLLQACVTTSFCAWYNGSHAQAKKGVVKMGKQSGKPGPDPKSPIEKAAVPSPYRAGGRSGSPLEELQKKQKKQMGDWLKTHRA